MEKEDSLYRIIDGNYGREIQAFDRYVQYDIETSRMITENGIESLRLMREQLDRQSTVDMSGSLSYSTEHGIRTNFIKKPDCVLDDVLLNLKRGLKPYYQEKLDYKIEGSNDGAYIEYEPGVDLSPAQKIEWLPVKTVEKINLIHEAKKKAFTDKLEADKKYLQDIAELDQAIHNYKTKGHNFII